MWYNCFWVWLNLNCTFQLFNPGPPYTGSSAEIGFYRSKHPPKLALWRRQKNQAAYRRRTPFHPHFSGVQGTVYYLNWTTYPSQKPGNPITPMFTEHYPASSLWPHPSWDSLILAAPRTVRASANQGPRWAGPSQNAFHYALSTPPSHLPQSSEDYSPAPL